jgi:hypothetical protein
VRVGAPSPGRLRDREWAQYTHTMSRSSHGNADATRSHRAIVDASAGSRNVTRLLLLALPSAASLYSPATCNAGNLNRTSLSLHHTRQRILLERRSRNSDVLRRDDGRVSARRLRSDDEADRVGAVAAHNKSGAHDASHAHFETSAMANMARCGTLCIDMSASSPFAHQENTHIASTSSTGIARSIASTSNVITNSSLPLLSTSYKTHAHTQASNREHNTHRNMIVHPACRGDQTRRMAIP